MLTPLECYNLFGSSPGSHDPSGTSVPSPPGTPTPTKGAARGPEPILPLPLPPPLVLAHPESVSGAGSASQAVAALENHVAMRQRNGQTGLLALPMPTTRSLATAPTPPQEEVTSPTPKVTTSKDRSKAIAPWVQKKVARSKGNQKATAPIGQAGPSAAPEDPEESSSSPNTASTDTEPRTPENKPQKRSYKYQPKEPGFAFRRSQRTGEYVVRVGDNGGPRESAETPEKVRELEAMAAAADDGSGQCQCWTCMGYRAKAGSKAYPKVRRYNSRIGGGNMRFHPYNPRVRIASSTAPTDDGASSSGSMPPQIPMVQETIEPPAQVQIPQQPVPEVLFQQVQAPPMATNPWEAPQVSLPAQAQRTFEPPPQLPMNSAAQPGQLELGLVVPDQMDLQLMTVPQTGLQENGPQQWAFQSDWINPMENQLFDSGNLLQQPPNTIGSGSMGQWPSL